MKPAGRPNNSAQRKANAEKPLLSVLAGTVQKPPPIWLMRQAGRYLPEYRALRSRTAGFLELCYDPALASEITLQPVRRFALDAAIIFSDILVVPHALGQEVGFVEGEGPKLSPIHETADIAKLELSRVSEQLSPVYQAIAKVRQELSADVSLIGFAGAPWTVATYMIEGGSSRDFMSVRRWAYAAPDEFARLMDLLIEATSVHLCNQIEAGAEVVQLFDSWAGVLTAAGFQRWVVEPTAAIVRRVRERFKEVPIIGFPRGAGLGYLDYAENTGVSAVSLDSTISAEWAARVLQPLMPVQGNLDPVMLLAGDQPRNDATDKILRALGDGPLVFNLGHGVIKETAPEQVEELVQFVRTWQAREID